MADYNIINDTETDPEAPLRSSLFKRMVANPIAISEGALGAPRIAFEALGGWYTTAGGIGTFAFASRTTGGTSSFGNTIAGSSLTLVNATGVAGSGSLTGTWRCLGFAGGSSVADRTTLWQRIA